MDRAADMVRSLLPDRGPPSGTGEAYAPANIALCKYWGKRNEDLKLPVTGSLSVSLGPLGTRMSITVAESDGVWINGRPLAADHPARVRLLSFLDLFRQEDMRWEVRSENTLPMGAGLASSASAFASAVGALDDLHGWKLDLRERSLLARLGSGSACRSVAHGFMEWRRGERDDGMDSHAVPLETAWPDFRIGILTVSDAQKPVGSGEAMRRTRDTSDLYRSWPDQVDRDLPDIRQAVFDQDLDTLGRAAERNAMAMHATMMAAWPPVLYWRPETVDALHRVHALRADGLPVYATMDAGPNVKLLFTAESEAALAAAFPGLRVISPFPDA